MTRRMGSHDVLNKAFTDHTHDPLSLSMTTTKANGSRMKLSFYYDFGPAGSTHRYMTKSENSSNCTLWKNLRMI
jgi:hypothetical protein